MEDTSREDTAKHRKDACNAISKGKGQAAEGEAAANVKVDASDRADEAKAEEGSARAQAKLVLVPEAEEQPQPTARGDLHIVGSPPWRWLFSRAAWSPGHQGSMPLG